MVRTINHPGFFNGMFYWVACSLQSSYSKPLARLALLCWSILQLSFLGDCFRSYYCRVLKGGCPRGGGNWGTLRIPREDWGTLGNIRGITTPPKQNPIISGFPRPPKPGVWWNITNYIAFFFHTCFSPPIIKIPRSVSELQQKLPILKEHFMNHVL